MPANLHETIKEAIVSKKGKMRREIDQLEWLGQRLEEVDLKPEEILRLADAIRKAQGAA